MSMWAHVSEVRGQLCGASAFCLYMLSRDWIQATGLARQTPLPTEPSRQPSPSVFNFKDPHVNSIVQQSLGPILCFDFYKYLKHHRIICKETVLKRK